MSWFRKVAKSDLLRVQNNIDRLELLRDRIHELAYFGTASQSGGFQVLSDLLDQNIVLGRPRVHEKLKSALIGENNQKVVLDSPQRFKQIMLEAEDLINREIAKEKRELQQLHNDNDHESSRTQSDRSV